MLKMQNQSLYYGGGGYGYGGYNPYGAYGAYGGYNGGGYGYNGGWLWSLILLIIIVLQFGKNNRRERNTLITTCDGNDIIRVDGNKDQIDNSILFIIIVFLLVACSCNRSYYY